LAQAVKEVLVDKEVTRVVVGAPERALLSINIS
jgi:hypothetical protein